jgi:hypothetical protein
MARLRFWGLTLLALALVVQSGRSEKPKSADGWGLAGKRNYSWSKPEVVEATSVIYHLDELADEPEFCKWIAETIPVVIEAGTWSQNSGNIRYGNIRYYGPKKILVVYHTADVQAKVDAFLKKLKKAHLSGKEKNVAAGNTPVKDKEVVPARYQIPGLIKTSHPAPDSNFTYPLPPPARPPKHLFHFIIRYEGAGIVDSNVVKFMKAQNGEKDSQASDADKKAKKDRSPRPMPPAPPGPPKHLFHFIIRYEGAGIIDSNVVKCIKAQNEEKTSETPEKDNKDMEDKIKTLTVPELEGPVRDMTEKEDRKEKKGNKEKKSRKKSEGCCPLQ